MFTPEILTKKNSPVKYYEVERETCKTPFLESMSTSVNKNNLFMTLTK